VRLGIVSDTHDQSGRTMRAIDRLVEAGATLLIHCGDITQPDIVHICGASLPAYYVWGNNDYDQSALRAAMDATGGQCLGAAGIVTLNGRRIAVTHGDSPREYRRLLSEKPDYLLFGHSHVRLFERDGPTCQINPGALHRAPEWTVGLLDLESDVYQSILIER
jgi:putative phosphoesterase